MTYEQGDGALVWVYESKQVCSCQSLYAVINFGGVQPVFIPSVWMINVPPRIQIFLWLLPHNKLMTKDNLFRRWIEKSKECMFCSEEETISHLFFDCVIPKVIWDFVSDFCGSTVTCYIELADCQKKRELINTISCRSFVVYLAN